MAQLKLELQGMKNLELIQKGQRAPGRVFVCQGSPRELGLAQGDCLRDRIAQSRQALAQLEGFRLEQPWWLPYPLFRWLAERKARRLLAGPLARDFPEMDVRLRGITEGAGLGLEALYLLNALEPLLASVRGRTVAPCLGACSAVAVTAERSGIGEPIIARNFDYLPLIQPFYTVRDTRPQGRLRSLDFTVAPLAGAIDGMNEKGLCITYNYAFTTDTPSALTGTLSMVIAETLERCGTVTEAVDWITTRPRWGGGILMLADATGDVASLELSSTRSRLRRPAPGQDVLFHTNAFSCSEMCEIQVPPDAVFNERAPTALRGRRVLESSEVRDRRLTELLDRPGLLDPDELAALMADHGPDGVPGDYTLCVHGSYWYTTACLQFFPRSRRMRVAYSTACRARYEETQL